MKNVWGAASLLAFVVGASSAAADDVPLYDAAFRRPSILFFAAAKKDAEFYRTENGGNISRSMAHSRNGNSAATAPAGGKYSYQFLAKEGFATGQPGMTWDGREGALAYANLTDASGTKPNTTMAYGFSVYLPSALYTNGNNYPPWVANQTSYPTVHYDRIFKLTSTSLPWVPVLEISANQGVFNITYRGGSFDITDFNQSATARPNLCKDVGSVPIPFDHVRVTRGASTANVWHDFIVVYKGSSSGASGRVVVWHRTVRGAQEPWESAWVDVRGTDAIPVRTAFYDLYEQSPLNSAYVNPGTVAACVPLTSRGSLPEELCRMFCITSARSPASSTPTSLATFTIQKGPVERRSGLRVSLNTA